MNKFDKNKLVFEHTFCNGFSCAVDKDGIIWIHHIGTEWERPCMKACYEDIKANGLDIAKNVLALSCEIQGDSAVTERASKY